jgi:hypothetical protein
MRACGMTEGASIRRQWKHRQDGGRHRTSGVLRDMIGEWLGHFSGSCLEPKVHF